MDDDRTEGVAKPPRILKAWECGDEIEVWKIGLHGRINILCDQCGVYHEYTLLEEEK
jgi:hypothetical protein